MKGLIAFALIGVISLTAGAEIIKVEPDGCADGADISRAFEGVTLSSCRL